MEKRLFLAFILSFLVLLVWGSLFPSPKQPHSNINATQPLENQGFIDKYDNEQVPQQSGDFNIQVNNHLLTNDNIDVETQDIGGKINKISLIQYAERLPVSEVFNIQGHEYLQYLATTQTQSDITYSGTFENANITKTFAILDNSYNINVQIKTIIPAEMSNLDNMNLVLFTFDASAIDKKIQSSRDLSLYELSYKTSNQIKRWGNFIKSTKNGPNINIQRQNILNESIHWICLRNKYFCFVIKPNFQLGQIKIIPLDKLRFQIIANPLPMQNPLNFTIYSGPQNVDLLKQNGIDDIYAFSNFVLLDKICKIISLLLKIIHKVIPNWGICILILGALIYLVTFPLTLKSMSSMRKLQEIQPKINQLKEQYKSNPQRLSKEQMELFKENKINPAGGCLPMLLQMPIFIGFYQVLWRSVMLKGASFLWIKDLAEPDRLFILPISLPVLGSEFNLFPFLMGFVMFFQQKFSSRNMPTTDPNQASQQKMMMFLLPIMMVFIFYKAASGLTLYFTFFYLLTTFTQWKMSKVNQSSTNGQ